MKRNEQMIIASIAVIGVIVGFWLLVVSPKREEAAKLDSQVSDLQSSLSDAQQQVTAGEQARKSFGIDYRRLVVLGKAVPADSEQASLLVQLQRLATSSGVQFQGIDLSQSGDGSGATAATSSTPPPPPPTGSSSSGDPSATGSASSMTGDSSSSTTPPATSSTATSAPATEAAASTLPIGATVGPAGLPVMDYDLSFTGEFFQIADFMQHVDSMVHTRNGRVDVRGRLLTVNGFTLEPSDNAGPLTDPVLTAEVHVTTYLTPADQGLTAGATPTGPAAGTPTLTSASSAAGSTTDSASAAATSTTSAP